MRTSFQRLFGMLAVICTATALATPAAALPAAPPDIRDALERVPGLTVVAERDAPDGFRFFELTFTQPADHRKPGAGDFEQRLTLLHRDTGAPMVMHTTGYGVAPRPNRSEPARLVNGNQLSIEHRYFKPSIPERENWPEQLTIRQAATDQHRIVTAVKSVYSGNWLTTGHSKGGMAAVYFNRFYPDDVDGTIAYGAPNDVIDPVDSHASFLARVGTDRHCREALRAVQREALQRRDELHAMAAEEAESTGQTFEIVGSLDKAMELAVVDLYFAFWQFRGQRDCGSVPQPDASNKRIYEFFDATQGLLTYSDWYLEYVYPYYYQAGAQFGFREVYDGYLRDLLRYPGEYEPSTFVPDAVRIPPFDHHAMPDIDAWVRTRGSRLLFIYGANDPWSAEPFEPGPGSRDSYRYDVPGGNHYAEIGRLPPEQAAEATATIRRWAGLDGRTARETPTPADAPPGFDAHPLPRHRPRV